MQRESQGLCGLITQPRRETSSKVSRRMQVSDKGDILCKFLVEWPYYHTKMEVIRKEQLTRENSMEGPA